MLNPVTLSRKVFSKAQDFLFQSVVWCGRLVGRWKAPGLLLIFLPTIRGGCPSGQIIVSPLNSNVTQIIPWKAIPLIHEISCDCLSNSTGVIQEILLILASRVNASTSVAKTFSTLRIYDLSETWEFLLENVSGGIFKSIVLDNTCYWEQHYCVDGLLDNADSSFYKCSTQAETEATLNSYTPYLTAAFTLTLLTFGVRFAIYQYRKPTIDLLFEKERV